MHRQRMRRKTARNTTFYAEFLDVCPKQNFYATYGTNIQHITVFMQISSHFYANIFGGFEFFCNFAV